MKTDVTITQDTRRAKKAKSHSTCKEKIYPVKLRVYSPLLKRWKMYSTGFDMTVKEFESVWQTEKPRKIHQEKRNYLDAIRVKAVEAAENCDPFSFETFEKKLLRRKGDGKNVFYHFGEQIKLLKELGRYSTAESYELSLKSIKNYLKDKQKSKSKTKQEIKEPTSLSFNSINELFLKKYETYMISKGKSKTTVGIYLRNLRAIFNLAINEGEISEDIYPFGKGKYKIPKGRAVKKALTKQQILALIKTEPEIPEQKKAKDFWLFSFICNGINMKDIALLKYKNLKGDRIEFERAKTENTNEQ
ncbi:MAG: phage integrase SAM-like domain-containing protein [Bacteroidota bacterium]